MSGIYIKLDSAHDFAGFEFIYMVTGYAPTRHEHQKMPFGVLVAADNDEQLKVRTTAQIHSTLGNHGEISMSFKRIGKVAQMATAEQVQEARNYAGDTEVNIDADAMISELDTSEGGDDEGSEPGYWISAWVFVPSD